MKRILLFLLTNILVITMLTIVLKVTGLESYIYQEFGAEYSSLAIFCFIFGMAGSFTSLLLSKFMAKKMMGVVVVNKEPNYKELVSMVTNLARKANIKTPEVGVYDSPEINAFATGASKNSSLVAVSTGLLNKMDREGLNGVLGHEIAHIANGDMVTMTLLQGILNTFVMFFSRIVANILIKDSRNFFAYFAVVMVLQIVFGLLASIVVAFFSRWREYRADAGGANLAGKLSMITALEQLSGDKSIAKQVPETSFSAFKISNFSSHLLSTHPSLENRIKRLKEGAY